MSTTYVSDAQLEYKANRLLSLYESQLGNIAAPPVPVEELLETVLDLNILWSELPEKPLQTVLAALHPQAKRVVFNDNRRNLIESTPGLYNTILAHELGHWEIHVRHGIFSQRSLFGYDSDYLHIYQRSGSDNDIKEVQAHKFMGYLLLPARLLRPAIQDVDLLEWSNLYMLRDTFAVTISALIIRLERLKLIHITDSKEIYPSRQEAQDQKQLFVE